MQGYYSRESKCRRAQGPIQQKQDGNLKENWQCQSYFSLENLHCFCSQNAESLHPAINILLTSQTKLQSKISGTGLIRPYKN